MPGVLGEQSKPYHHEVLPAVRVHGISKSSRRFGIAASLPGLSISPETVLSHANDDQPDRRPPGGPLNDREAFTIRFVEGAAAISRKRSFRFDGGS